MYKDSVSIDSFHISYNARHSKPEDVAKTFIYNNDFEELLFDNHTVLLGARGCGKTTLMKMLTLPALYSWENELAQKTVSKLNFFAIYISTDIYWNAQKDAYNTQLEKFPRYAEYVSKVAVTTNVLFALCETIENILKYKIGSWVKQSENELAKELIEIWKLPPTIPNLIMVKEGLVKRTDTLNQHIQRTVFNCRSDNDITLNEGYFHLDYDTATLSAVNVFERIFSLDKNSKWALCFDELELAPEWLQERLFASLRSRNQKFLYKLSASPIVSVSKDMLATPKNDFKLIKMWPHNGNKEYLAFSEKIVRSILYKIYGREVDPELILGSNPILRKEKDNYKKDGNIWIEIKKLAETDQGLRELLLKHNINPNDPIADGKNSRKLDTVLRKIKPIVYFRNYYSQWVESTHKRKSRSRKAHTLFYGKEVIYKISDGNPRWLIGILTELLLNENTNANAQKISETKQAAVLENIAEQFFNVIKIIPGAVITKKNSYITLHKIIEEIGSRFFSEIVINDFRRDPHSTFIIDKNISNEYLKILEKGVYQGALIMNDPDVNGFDFDMRQKNFRLSYLFSPKFKLPIRKYASVTLSSCLTGNEKVSTEQIKMDF